MVALLIASGVALIVALVSTPALIKVLQARGIGQQIREDGPRGHVTKAGTPTMGGVTIVVAVTVGYLVAHVRSGQHGALFPTSAGALVLFAVLGNAAVGLVDDWIKVSRQRSLGLNKRTKLAGQLVVAVTFGLLAVNQAKVDTDLSFTRPLHIHMSAPVYVAWAVIVIIGSSNALNLTDGLDGLAAGSGTYAFAAFVFIGFWEFRHGIHRVPAGPYDLGPALDLSMFAAAMTGACAGFLWWNAAPARIFMGDTGSLAIGAGLGALALTTNTQLLLPIIGGLYVLETLSVVVQVVSFRVFGRRVFRMAPVHHHFELMGWPETTVIVRFWILAGLFTSLAVGIFYADFLSTGFVG
ncbi:MAG: phospho-N-acetylmuramoyl-pentapeptide-transferase [Acidimicrobiales bacterium]